MELPSTENNGFKESNLNSANRRRQGVMPTIHTTTLFLIFTKGKKTQSSHKPVGCYKCICLMKMCLSAGTLFYYRLLHQCNKQAFFQKNVD